jgi:hypothetical protein
MTWRLKNLHTSGLGERPKKKKLEIYEYKEKSLKIVVLLYNLKPTDRIIFKYMLIRAENTSS